jgi:mannosyltransferase
MSTAEYHATPAPSPLLRVPIRDRVRAVSAETWLLWGVIGVATVIRILTINNQSMWADEALTAYEARLPLGAMAHIVQQYETTPPLYFFVVWAWAHVFGTGAVALRSVSTIAGVALVPISYLCGRELVSRRVGLLAAAFVAVNPFLIWYSQEARAYMLLTALCGLSFLWFLYSRRDPTRRNVALWGAWSALALATHFFAGFLVFGEALWLMWIHRNRLVLGATALLAVLQLAMIPFAASDAQHGTGWIHLIPLHNRVANAVAEWGASILFRRTPVSVALLLGAAMVVLVAVMTLLGGDARTRRAALLAGALAGFVWLAPIALRAVGQDYFLSRNVMPAVVPVAVLLAAACLAPRARVVGGVLAAGLLALFCWSGLRVQTHAYLERPNWQAVAEALGPARVSRVILAANGTTAQPLKIYLPRVAWSRPERLKTTIEEIDVVGATKKLPVIPHDPVLRALVLSGLRRYPGASPVPAKLAPPGTLLLRRFPVHTWVLARFKLKHPIRVDLPQVEALATHFFLHDPRDLLIFFQRPGR